MHPTYPVARRTVTPPLNSTSGEAPSAEQQRTAGAPKTLTGPLAELAALQKPTHGLSDMPATVLDRIAFHLDTPVLRRLSRAHPTNDVLDRLTQRRDAAAIAAVLEGLPRSLDPDEGAALIRAAVAGHAQAQQAEILAGFAWQLPSLRMLPNVRQAAIEAFLAADEQIKMGRPPALDAAAIALEAESLKTLEQFRALLDKARALPDEHRGKVIAAIGRKLLAVHEATGRRLYATMFFLEAAAEVKTHRPELLESLVEAAREGRQGFLQREQRMLAAGGEQHAALLESRVLAAREQRQGRAEKKQSSGVGGVGLPAALLQSLVIAPRDDEQGPLPHKRDVLGEGGDLHRALMNSIPDEAVLAASNRFGLKQDFRDIGVELYALLQRSFALAAREGTRALLRREQRLLAEGGDLHASLLQGRISCDELAVQHGIVVDHFCDVTVGAATSRVRAGENLVDVRQNLYLHVDGLYAMNNIVSENAQRALDEGEKVSCVIERLGIHDRDGITKLIRDPVKRLVAEGVKTVPDIMQKLDFSDPRYARLASKCVQKLAGKLGLETPQAAATAAAAADRRVPEEVVEIAQAARIELAEPLDLPRQPDRVLREACADLSLAQEGEDSTARVASVADQPFWQASLETQPAYNDAIAQLHGRHTEQIKKLDDWDTPRRLRATQKERDSKSSDLNQKYGRKLDAIDRQHEEGVKSVHRQFTRIAMDRVAAGLPPVDTALPLPPHVIAAAKVSDIATQLQGLILNKEAEEARILARQLVEPELMAALHPALRPETGRGEAEAMDTVNVQYMELLGMLATEQLLDDVVFDRLRGADTWPRKRETPYLLYIASRAGSGGQDMPVAAPELARAVVQLITTLAETRELTDGQSREEMYAEMCEALLRSNHPGQTQGRPKTFNDFFSRLLLSGSPDAPGAGALCAARALDAAGLLPGTHAKTTPLTCVSLAEFEKVAKQARKLPSPSLQSDSKTLPAQSQGLADVVRTLREQNVAAAHAKHMHMQSKADAAKQVREHADNVHFSIYSAVSSAVNTQWAAGVRGIRKDITPHILTGMWDAATATAGTSAANSLSDTAPKDMATHLYKALLALPQGQDLLQRGQIYNKDDQAEHSEFEKLMQDAVASYVRRTLASTESSLRSEAREKVATWKAADAAVREALRQKEDADAALDTEGVHERARRPETSSGGLPSPSTWGVGSSAKRARSANAAPQTQSQQPVPYLQAAPAVPKSAAEGAGLSDAAASAQNLRMPTAPGGPVGGAERHPTGSMDR